MRYCTECGKKLLKPNLKFCPECGAALSKETPPPISGEQPPAALSAKAGTEKPAAEEPAKSRKPGFRALLFVLGMLLVFGILFSVLLVGLPVLFFYLSGGSYDEGQDACANVTCSNYCNGNIRYYNGFCVVGQCQYYPEVCPNGCSNGSCNSPKPLEPELSQIYISVSHENEDPYYGSYCDKINPYDLSVREAVSEAIKKHPGRYSVDQLFDIFDWVKANIEYQNVPLGGIPYPASETLATKSGDCKNQAVLVTSMVRAIGGTAKVVADSGCSHAYAIVHVGSSEVELSNLSRAIASHYGSNSSVDYFRYNNGTVNYLVYNNSIWVIFDTAGGNYLGSTLKNCSGNRTLNMITSCLDCVNSYPNKPYTFNDKCYSQCPSGAVTANQYACKPCPAGYQSYNDQCLKCQTGWILGTDGLCHEPCGGPTTYCPAGDYCSNGRCYRS
ncbi:MAG: zinc-ribbon domain-containing protein [Candidatus Micrarchaeota archaeon]|nr:zinc-ribbon domain-containing protein [Candidatus Micrarchaeota archaeon]